MCKWLTPLKAAGEGGSDPSSELPFTYPREALRIPPPVAQYSAGQCPMVPSGTLTQERQEANSRRKRCCFTLLSLLTLERHLSISWATLDPGALLAGVQALAQLLVALIRDAQLRAQLRQHQLLSLQPQRAQFYTPRPSVELKSRVTSSALSRTYNCVVDASADRALRLNLKRLK